MAVPIPPTDTEVVEYAAEPLEPKLPAGGKNSLFALVSESAVYGIGMILGRGLGFFLTPILARSFNAREFGVLDLMQTGVLLCSMLLSFQMESALLRYYQEEPDKRLLVSTYLMTQLATGALFMMGVALVGVPLAGRYASLPGSMTMAAAWSVVAGLIWTHAITLLRAERTAALAATMISLDTAVNIVVVLTLVVWLKWGITGYFAARAFSNMACSLTVLVLRRDLYRPRFSPSVLMRFLRFGLPLTPEGFVSFATSQVGKGFLLSYASLADVGLLAVTNRVATGIKLVLASLRQAWAPYAFSVANDANADEAYAAAFHGYARLAGFLMIAFVLLSREAVLILAGPQYLQARWLLGLVTAGAMIGGLPYLFNIGLLLGEKTVYYTVGVAASAVTVLLFSWLLIARFGLVGAPLSGLAGSLVLTGTVLYFAQKIRPVPYKMRVLWGFVGGVLAAAALGTTRLMDGPLMLRLLALTVAAVWMLRDVPLTALWARLAPRLIPKKGL